MRFIVVGATGAIGSTLCERLSLCGAVVVALDRIARDGVDIVTDVTDESDVEHAVAKLRSKGVTYDGFIYAAGVEGPATPVLATPIAEFEMVQRVNVSGFLLTLKHFTSLLNDGASIVAIGSISGLRGNPHAAAYVTSKHALIGLVRCAAIEFAPRQIRVNCVAPGPLESQMMRAFESTHADNAMRTWYERQTPLRRYGTVQDVAALVQFLLSEQSTFLTGGVYVCDGGLTAAGRPL